MRLIADQAVHLSERDALTLLLVYLREKLETCVLQTYAIVCNSSKYEANAIIFVL